MKVYFLWKRAPSALFLFFIIILTSCSPKMREWCSDECITPPCPEFRSAKLFLCPCNPARELEVEILLTYSERHLFINVHSLEIPECEEDRATVTIVYENGMEEEFLAYRLAGGQRLVVPDDIADRLICELLGGHPFQLKAGHYCSEISVLNFPNLFRSLA